MSIFGWDYPPGVTGSEPEIAGYPEWECPTCGGSGEVERTIGGDGYGGRCAGTMDVPCVCSECDGSGTVDYDPQEEPEYDNMAAIDAAYEQGRSGDA